MCGRYDLNQTRDRLPADFRKLRVPAPEYDETPDARPRAMHPILRAGDGDQLECVLGLWWFVPSYTRDKTTAFKFTTFNARADRVETAPTFRAAYKARHCIVPAAAVYEWEAEPSLPGKKKRKVRISRKDGSLLAMAGLWETWADKATGEVLTSYTIITTEANTVFASVPHDRMPVLLAPEHYGAWLDHTQDCRALLQPGFDADLMAEQVA